MTKATEKLILALAFGLLGAVCLLAQENSSCLRRSFDVSVTDDSLRPFVGLTAANFRATYRGKPVRILSAEPDTRPNHAVILLDMSGSMTEAPEMLLSARSLVLSLIARVPPDSRVGLITFSDGILERLGFDRSRQEMTDFATKAAPPQGKRKTALRDAILEALHMLGQSGPQDVIYVVTDGGDNASKTSGKKLKPTLLAARARLYAILLPLYPSLPSNVHVPHPALPEERYALTELREVADASGGTIVYYQDLDSSKKADQNREWFVRNLIASVRESYRLEVELPQAPEERHSWKLELVGLPKHKGPVHLSYPRDLLPCADLSPKN